MKKLLALSLLSILLFVGCDQGSDITSPLTVSNTVGILPDIPGEIEVIRWPYKPGADSIFIPISIPESEMPHLKKSKKIDGKDGGRIIIDHKYQTSNGDTVSIWVKLVIPEDAFDKKEEIFMMHNNEFGAISFYPHMVFDKPVKLNIRYRGIDLSNINPDSVDFIFQNYDGSTEQIEYTYLIVEPTEGRLELKRAKLHHFSRYGWIR